MSDQPISNREFLAYRAEFRNSLFRQIHRRLRKLREKGFTQKRMAKRLGMDEGQLSRCLRGENDLRLETLADLARALDCRISTSLVPLQRQASFLIEQRYDNNGQQNHVEPAWSAKVLEMS